MKWPTGDIRNLRTKLSILANPRESNPPASRAKKPPQQFDYSDAANTKFKGFTK